MKNFYFKFVKEINDPIEKESFIDKNLRYTIRLIINMPFKSSWILKILKYFCIKKENLILINKNIFYKNYMIHLKKGELKEILKLKNRWSNYIIKEKSFHEKNSINLAINYKKIIDNYKNKRFEEIKSCKDKKVDFYIYGPNSKSYPNKIYKNATLVLTKFPKFKVNKFRKKILFLNNHSLIYTDKKILKNKCKEFNTVFIPKGSKKTLKNMEYMPEIPQDNLAGPMGLARILYCLKSKAKEKKLCINLEGFDLGLYKEGYSMKIETFFKKESFDNEYRKSLLMHDFIYNFLLLKDLIKSFEIHESQKFVNILNMDLKYFFKEMHRVREFRKFKNIYFGFN